MGLYRFAQRHLTRQVSPVSRCDSAVRKRTARRRRTHYPCAMATDPSNTGRPAVQIAVADAPNAGYGHAVRGSRKGLGGDPPSGPRRPHTPAATIPGPSARPLSHDVIPMCPLCHTGTVAVTAQTLSEGAYWRCERCGQMWDAIRLQTAADYSRYAEDAPPAARATFTRGR